MGATRCERACEGFDRVGFDFFLPSTSGAVVAVVKRRRARGRERGRERDRDRDEDSEASERYRASRRHVMAPEGERATEAAAERSSGKPETTASERVHAGRAMRENDVVLLEMNDGERATFATLRAGKVIDLGKRARAPAEAFLGAPFGSMYEARHNTGEVERIGATTEVINEETDDEEAFAAPLADERSNKNVPNTEHGAQTLTDSEIAALKREFTGEEMVEIIAAYSKTFEEKTAFAQEKYKARKLKKHMTKILARFPSPRVVCEQYFYENPSKTSYMRFDSLSMLMNMANVGAHGQTLVLETCGGLVLGSIMHRMGGFGRICNGFVGTNPTGMEVVQNMNFDPTHYDSVRHASLSGLIEARQKGAVEADTMRAKSMETTEPSTAEKKERVYMKMKFTNDGDMSDFTQHGFSSLVIASLSVEPKAVLEQLLPLCASSASFAVWFNASQPLAEAYYYLRNSNVAVNLSLIEPFLRAQQVLPGRTHPVMTTDAGSGGFILSGTYVGGVNTNTPNEANKKLKREENS